MSGVNLSDPFDRIILGQNQFFGVNHISDRKAMERERHFADVANVVALLEAGLEAGVTGLTITTHPRTPEILDAIRRHPRLREELAIYPGIPDPGKLMRLFAELGPVKTLQAMLGKASLSKQLRMAVTGLGSFVTKDFVGLLRTLIDIELGPFAGLRIRGVFLTNNMNDLALGLDMKDVFQVYFEHVLEKVGAVPAFNTVNLPFHRERLRRYGLPEVPVMAAVNPLGFYVNPSLEAFRQAAEGARVVAMSTLASGRVGPEEAYAFLAGVPGIESVTVGASTREHVNAAAGSLRKHLGRAWGTIEGA